VRSRVAPSWIWRPLRAEGEGVGLAARGSPLPRSERYLLLFIFKNGPCWISWVISTSSKVYTRNFHGYETCWITLEVKLLDTHPLGTLFLGFSLFLSIRSSYVHYLQPEVVCYCCCSLNHMSRASSSSNRRHQWPQYGTVPLMRCPECERPEPLLRLTSRKTENGNYGREFVKCPWKVDPYFAIPINFSLFGIIYAQLCLF
jgi:hypothetical protein